MILELVKSKYAELPLERDNGTFYGFVKPRFNNYLDFHESIHDSEFSPLISNSMSHLRMERVSSSWIYFMIVNHHNWSELIGLRNLLYSDD